MNKKEIFYEDKKNCEIPLTHITDGITDQALLKIDELYGAADILSIENAQKHNKILLLLSVIGTVITMAFLLYDEAEIHGLILACIIMILFLFLTRRIANRLDCHRKYIEYRVLAETLRLQFFLSIAGVKQHVSDILPWFIKKGLPWIDELILTLHINNVQERMPVIDCWIRDQKAYHDSALKKAENKKHRDERTTKIVIVVTIIAYIVTLLFELFIYNASSTNIDANAVRAILKIIVGTMSAITLFTGSYYGKMSLSNSIEDHKRMSALYQKAEKDIMESGETEELLISLAREYLIENSTWYSYQTKNKPDIVF
jgi:hypothetical protein